MALQTFNDIKTEVTVRLSVSTTMAFYTDAILNSDIDIAHRWASAYKLWPFTVRHDGSIAQTSATETYAIPADIVPNSIEFLQLGTFRHTKLNFEDYQIYREDFPSGQERIWSDFGGLLYINPMSDKTGTVDFWAHYIPAITTISDTVNTVFENAGSGSFGNEAIVNEVISYAMGREKKYNAVKEYHDKATEILDKAFATMALQRETYLTKNHDIFKRFDVLKGALREDLIKRDQFY